MSDAPENVGNFHVVSIDGRTANFLTTVGLPDTQKALAWAKRNVTPSSGSKYAVIQITKRINVDFKPRLVEAEGMEPLPSEGQVPEAPKPLIAKTVAFEAATEPAPAPEVEVEAPPVEAPKPVPKAPPRPPAPKRVEVPVQSPAGMAATVTAPVAAPALKTGPSLPKPPPPPRPPVAAPKAAAPAASPAGGGGIDDLDLA